VPQLVRGRIVEAEVVDPQGRNRKQRPLIIVTATDEIQAGTPLVAVAVSTTFPHPIPDDCVELPFHPGGQSRTGLRKRSVAVCSWLATLTHADVTREIGHVPAQQMLVILEKVKELTTPADEQQPEPHDPLPDEDQSPGG
jgi:mRNA-degrading endonuclease toxin of MazEF toxin-antitoxin module